MFHLIHAFRFCTDAIPMIPENSEIDYYTIPEAAEIFSVGRTTMWRWFKEGQVKSCMTLGGQHRIRKADLELVLVENQAYRVAEPGTAPELKFQKNPLPTPSEFSLSTMTHRS